MIELGAGKKVPEPWNGTPFPAIVGQAELKEALLAVGANDALDGLLVRGEKGTAKSTAVRALVELLPDQRVVGGCPFGCPPGRPERQCSGCRDRSDPPVETRPVPLVTLPLGAARERVTGSLSVADALDGSAEFDPGLLARANRGILYVDEVNLLDDHLVDVVLDAAADGRNRVERDGVSVTHPADVTLIGTMNPEEGSLRPQFRDRFALQVEVQGSDDVDERVTVIERALSGFDGDYAESTEAARNRLQAARERLPAVSVPDSLLEAIAELCLDCGIEGHRGDIATARAARTIAALDGRERVIETDVRRGAEYALPHRLSSRPFEDAPDLDEVVDDHFADDRGSEETNGESDRGGEKADGESDGEGTDGSGHEDGTGDSGHQDGAGDSGHEATTSGDQSGDRSGPNDREPTDDPGERQGPGNAVGPPEGASPETADCDGNEGGPEQGSPECGRGDTAPGASEDGHENGDGNAPPSGDDEREAATPLVPGQRRQAQSGSANASAPDLESPRASRPDGTGRSRAKPGETGRGARVRTRPAGDGDPIDAAASIRSAATCGRDAVTSRDLRSSVRTGEASTLVAFAMDASASMRGPMRAARGVALALLQDAYERRDEVAVVTFAGESADVVLPPTDSVDRAARHLKSLPTGDRTPLPAGLETTAELLERADPDAAVVVVVTDGRANAADRSPTAATRQAGRALAETGAAVLVVDAGDGGRADLTADLVAATGGDRVPLEVLTAERVAGSVPDPGDRGG